MFVVLEGEAHIELPDRDGTVIVRAGEMATFDGGTRSDWTFPASFCKFTVITG